MLKNGGGADRRVLIVLDEAHTLTSSELKVVRMLTSYRSASSKLLHLMLAGRPELSDMLSRPPLLDLRRRITVVSPELHFNVIETERYINHRLKMARQSEPPIFRRDAVSEIVAVSRGIPRQINVICSEAMSKARELDTKQITGSIIREIITDPAFQLLSTPARQVDRPEAEGKNRAEQSRPRPLVVAAVDGPTAQCINSIQSGRNTGPSRLPLLQQIRLPQIVRGSYQEVLAAGLAAVAVAVISFGVLYALTFGLTAHRTAEVAVTTQIATPQPQHQSVAPLSAAKAGSRVSNSEAERSENLPLRSPFRPNNTNHVLTDEQPGSQTPIASNREGATIDRLADPPVPRSVDTADTGSELPPPLPTTASLRMPILNASGLNARVPASTPVADGFQNLSDTTSPEVVKMVRPNYPSKAKKQKIHGEVVVTGVVGADGRLKLISTSGPTLLEEAAVKAAQEWRYKPPTLNGSPVEATARIVFNFSQPD
jgi:TonB family protein